MAFPIAFACPVHPLTAKDPAIERGGSTLTTVMASTSDSHYSRHQTRGLRQAATMLLPPSPLPVSWSGPSCPFVRLVCFVLSSSTSGFRSSMSSICYVSLQHDTHSPRHPNPPERIHHPIFWSSFIRSMPMTERFSSSQYPLPYYHCIGLRR